VRVTYKGVDAQFPYYNVLLLTHNREDAVWGYFDGAHYLHLAEFGYDSTGPQAFFPLYPTLVSAVHRVTGANYFDASVGLSCIFLILSLIVCEYLFEKKSDRVIMTLLLFPVSFFLCSMYTESLFLFLSLLFFLLLRHRQFWASAVVAGVASATRLVGAFLSLALLCECYRYIKVNFQTFNTELLFKTFALWLVSISGLIIYMHFLFVQFHDPLMFLHVQSMFGAERSGDKLILLPQVLYRYAKMIWTVDRQSFLYQRILLEFASFCGACYLLIRNWRRVPTSWSIYLTASLMIPTLTGNLSSMPRYILVLVPFLAYTSVTAKNWYIWMLLSCLLLIYLFWFYAGGMFVA
jgi:hypothetical protein